MAIFKKQRCYNCKFGNKTDPKSLKMCKTCGLPFQRRNWKELITEEQQEEALFIIKELLKHCRALKALVHEDVPKLNENIAMTEKFLRDVE